MSPTFWFRDWPNDETRFLPARLASPPRPVEPSAMLAMDFIGLMLPRKLMISSVS